MSFISTRYSDQLDDLKRSLRDNILPTDKMLYTCDSYHNVVLYNADSIIAQSPCSSQIFFKNNV